MHNEKEVPHATTHKTGCRTGADGKEAAPVC